MDLSAIISQIESFPNSVEPYLVYADALQENGDVLGELIALHHVISQQPGNHSATFTHRALLKKHGVALQGGVQLGKACVFPDWHMGFWRELRVIHTQENLADLLPALLSAPLARFLQKLYVFNDSVSPRLSSKLQKLPLLLRDKLHFVRKYKAENAKKEPSKVQWLYLCEDEIGDLPMYQNLEYIELSYEWSSPVGVLCDVSHLRGVFLRGVRELPLAFLTLSSLSVLDKGTATMAKGFHLGRINDMLRGWALARTPIPQRLIEANLLLGRQAEVQLLATKEDLLGALDSNVAQIGAAALEALARHLPSNFGKPGPGSGDEIAVLGETNLKLSEVRSSLAERSIKLSRNIGKNTTHVVLGRKPAGTQRQVSGLPIFLESSLLSLWPPELRADAKPSGDAEPKMDVEALSQLLQDSDEKSVKTAVSLLAKSGVPTQLLPELLLIAQDTDWDKKLRNEAKKLFAAYAPTNVIKATKLLGRTIFINDAVKQESRITDFCATSGFDPFRFAKLIMGKGKWVSGGALLAHSDHPEHRRWFLNKCVDGNRLAINHTGLRTIPVEIAELDMIVDIDAGYNRLEELPPVVVELPKLGRLDLYNNRLKSLPDEFAQAKTLRELDLSSNRFSSFPKQILSLTGLRELDLSCQDCKKLIVVPSELKRLSSLRKLSLSGVRFGDFSSLLTLEKLEELDLWATQLPKEIPDELKRLKNLKKLKVMDTCWEGQEKRLRVILPNLES